VNSFRPRRRNRHAHAFRPSAASGEPRHHQNPVAVAVAPPAPMTPEIEARIAASPFAALGLSAPLLRGVLDEGYEQPTPVQSEVVPHAIAGRDVLAGAQTGTGKTAAFVLPILQHLAETPGAGGIRALILTPTRELAAQIGERISVYGRYVGLGHAVVYGGVSQHRQERDLRARPAILVATPGRLLDLMQQGLVRLSGITHLVLDEADRMLDMGFIYDVRRICAAVPAERQTMFFSATVPSSIESFAKSLLRDPVRVAIQPAVTTAERVEQSVVFVERAAKRVLLEKVLGDPEVSRAIVFTRTKHGANRLSEQLERAGIDSAAIHGNKSQGARERALDAFRNGTTRVLVATDVAARGIDVDGVSHVINYDLPNAAESYVHRIGRTGRAGAVGRAISFCGLEERGLLADIERFIKTRLPATQSDGTTTSAVEPLAFETQSARPLAPGEGRGPRGRRRRFH
jgi:ATP-dependent RNA helicase RhlE